MTLDIGPHAHIYTRNTPEPPDFFLTAWSNCTICDQPPEYVPFDAGYATALRDVEAALLDLNVWHQEDGCNGGHDYPMALGRSEVFRAIASLRKPVTP